MDELNLAELDYPVPDPTWDYCEVYWQAIARHREATAMIAAMSAQERSSPEADQAIRDSLREISWRVNEMMGRLD
jgi:hypothetical protein